MGKGTKEMLHKILANQQLIMEHLKIKVPVTPSVASNKTAPAKTATTVTGAAKSKAGKASVVKKVQRKK